MAEERIIEVRDYGAHEKPIRAVRTAVFVVEQQIALKLEYDGEDHKCTHALIMLGDEPIATGRMYRKGHPEAGHIGRIAVLKQHRRKGYGSKIMQTLMRMAEQDGLPSVYLGSQVSAVGFYESLGFEPYGDRFIEADIEHQHMRKVFKKKPEAEADQ